MAEIHNTARQRLARATTPHPEADLLAAFAEGGLRGAERDQVLAHLSACADCREVVLLAQPEEAEAATVTEVAPTRTWVSWYRLRWGAVAMSLVIVAGAILLYREGGEQQFQAPKVSAPQVADKSLPTSTAVSPPPPATSGKTAVTTSEYGRAARVTPAQTTAAGKDEEKVALDGADHKAKKESRGQPGTFAGTNESMGVNDQLAAAPTPKKPATPTGVGGGGVVGGLATAKSTPATPPAPPPATSETVEVAAEPTQVTTTNGPTSNTNVDTTAQNSVVQNDATGVRNERQKIQKQDNAYLYSQPVLRDNAVANAKMRPATPHWQWRVTDAGALQRSTDAKHWQAMPLNTGVHFLAVVSSGTEVWAGGNGGALYHSTDDGAHWNKIALESTADIKGLTFTAPNHVLVTTAEGTQPVSEPQK